MNSSCRIISKAGIILLIPGYSKMMDLQRKNMKIVSIVLHGNFTDGMAYQENCLPYYQKKVYNAEVVIVAGQYGLKMGSNDSEINAPGEYACSNGLRLIRVPNGKGRFGKKLAYMPTLYDVLEEEQPDFIFAHLIQSISTKDVIKYKKRHPNVLVFGDSHADHINSAHGWFSKKILHGIIWKSILKEASKYFEIIYGVLPARVDFLKEMYNLPDHKVDLLLMGAEDELIDYDHQKEIRDRIRSELGIGREEFVLITGGKIDKRKNIEILFEALKSLHNDKVKLLIFGKPDNEMCSYMDEISNDDCVRYLGWLDSKSMYEFFHASDLCVFPGTHSVIWEQAVGYGLPGIFRHWEGIEHIDKQGNMEFFFNKSITELEDLLRAIILSKKKFESMRIRAKEVSTEFHYSTLALKSLGGARMQETENKQMFGIGGVN